MRGITVTKQALRNSKSTPRILLSQNAYISLIARSSAISPLSKMLTVFFIYFSCNEVRYDKLCHGTRKTSYLFIVRGWEQAVIQRREEISCFAHELTQEISKTKKHSNCLFKQGLNCSSGDSAFS